jgi:hypothetical protein
MMILVRTFIAVGCLSILALIVTNNAGASGQVGRSGGPSGQGVSRRRTPDQLEHRHEY